VLRDLIRDAIASSGRVRHREHGQNGQKVKKSSFSGFGTQWDGARENNLRPQDPTVSALFRSPDVQADTLKSLTEGVHTREALDMVKDHVKNVMGPAAAAYANTMLKMSKLQAAQVHHPQQHRASRLCACVFRFML